jgi:hypothetical protein
LPFVIEVAREDADDLNQKAKHNKECEEPQEPGYD